MLDSVGKPGSGIMDGNFKWLGSFEQCKSAMNDLNDSLPITFSTQYCLPEFLLVIVSKNVFTLTNLRNYSVHMMIRSKISRSE